MQQQDIKQPREVIDLVSSDEDEAVVLEPRTPALRLEDFDRAANEFFAFDDFDHCDVNNRDAHGFQGNHAEVQEELPPYSRSLNYMAADGSNDYVPYAEMRSFERQADEGRRNSRLAQRSNHAGIGCTSDHLMSNALEQRVSELRKPSRGHRFYQLDDEQLNEMRAFADDSAEDEDYAFEQQAREEHRDEQIRIRRSNDSLNRQLEALSHQTESKTWKKALPMLNGSRLSQQGLGDPFEIGAVEQQKQEPSNEQKIEELVDSDNEDDVSRESPAARRGRVFMEIVAVFPDICPRHVEDLLDRSTDSNSQAIVAGILDQMDKGQNYPKAVVEKPSLKRKVSVDEDEEIMSYADLGRHEHGHLYREASRELLGGDFADIPMSYINNALRQSNYLLFPTYQALDAAQKNLEQNALYKKIKKPRKFPAKYKDPELLVLRASVNNDLRIALKELLAGRRQTQKIDEKQRAADAAEAAERANEEAAVRDGAMQECGCCFADYPLNRMVHCDSDTITHFFCLRCAKTTAEHQLGTSRFELNCMSMDGCTASFSKDQRDIYLSTSSMALLDKLEMAAAIQAAGLDDFETCTKCDWGAIYPSTDVNRVFTCEAEGCKHQSCRLCKQDAHIPKTCEEASKERGLNIRLVIEEAMSDALIRKCNKCTTPFIKDFGCNKMICTKCSNIQCYICSKSCDYQHFNDSSRGGKAGNCPLFDGDNGVEQRHEEDVANAEKIALAQVLMDHPEYTEEDLKVKFSAEVMAKKRPAYRVNPFGPPPYNDERHAALRIQHDERHAAYRIQLAREQMLARDLALRLGHRAAGHVNPVDHQPRHHPADELRPVVALGNQAGIRNLLLDADRRVDEMPPFARHDQLQQVLQPAQFMQPARILPPVQPLQPAQPVGPAQPAGSPNGVGRIGGILQRVGRADPRHRSRQ